MSNQTRKPFVSDEELRNDYPGSNEPEMSNREVRDKYEAHLAEQEQTIADLRARVEALDIRRLAELAGEWFDFPIDNGPGSDIDKLEKYLRERLNKLIG